MTQSASRLNLITGEITESIQAPDHNTQMQSALEAYKRNLEAGAVNLDVRPGNLQYYRFWMPKDGAMRYMRGKNQTNAFQRVQGYGQDHRLHDYFHAQAALIPVDSSVPQYLIILDDEGNIGATKSGNIRKNKLTHAFAYKERDFNFGRDMNLSELNPKEDGYYTFNQFILATKGNIIARVAHSTSEVLHHVRDINKAMEASPGQSFENNVFVLYRDLVIAAPKFFFNMTPQPPFEPKASAARQRELHQRRLEVDRMQQEQGARRAQFAMDLHENKIGITTRDEFTDPHITTHNRVVSPPVFQRLRLTKTAADQRGAKGFTCNYIDTGPQSDLTTVLVPYPYDLRDSRDFKRIFDHMMQGGEISVIGSLSLLHDRPRLESEQHTDGHRDWLAPRVLVTNVERQVHVHDKTTWVAPEVNKVVKRARQMDRGGHGHEPG
jgi:hypothetical protein